MSSVGEQLIKALEARGVNVVFGIPGVHTVELYRGLAASGIRHVTTRHEQGAGFMADGYARVSGKPGVAFVITGPGVTNILTPMAQARADSVPMLMISSVNETASLGQGRGHLHELPDQLGLVQQLALHSDQVRSAGELMPKLNACFEALDGKRGGPVHLEIPLDILGVDYSEEEPAPNNVTLMPLPDVTEAVAALSKAKRPVILAGGGAKHDEALIKSLAERLDAPVVQTVNARGVLFDHPLSVPASPSLSAVRELLEQSDVLLGLGTEMGPTDIDMYRNDGFPLLAHFIRVDVDEAQLTRYPAGIALCGSVAQVGSEILAGLGSSNADNDGAARAKTTKEAALAELSPDMQDQIKLVETLRDEVPGAIIVGDSTQPIYATNLYYDHDRPGGWFNAATGYGALGFGIPAAIGAAIADPTAQVVCLTGDGGAQFTIGEMMTAMDEHLPILFIVWNNNGFGEIDLWMREAGVTAIGCDPTAPDFSHVAAANRMPFQSVSPEPEALAKAMRKVDLSNGPAMIEIRIEQ